MARTDCSCLLQPLSLEEFMKKKKEEEEALTKVRSHSLSTALIQYISLIHSACSNISHEA